MRLERGKETGGEKWFEGEKEEERSQRTGLLSLVTVLREDKSTNKFRRGGGEATSRIKKRGQLKSLSSPSSTPGGLQAQISSFTLPSRQGYALAPVPPMPLIQAVSMISQYPLATLLPWPAAPFNTCPDLDCSLLEGEGGVYLQRYQPRSPESSPRHWVSNTHSSFIFYRDLLLFHTCTLRYFQSC